MHMSQTYIIGWLWNQPRTAGNKQRLLILTHHEKEKDMAEEGRQGEIGQPWKNILVVAPADKHKTIQHKHRNEWQEVGRIKMTKDPQTCQIYFQEDQKELTVRDN